ncbi:alpha/beta fold hydrolase [Leifsonia sp. A12D58]|uniref:alpha/beta fold hydrolase n=1 Tax=Leifsonia sp. A12D58 TaxID=3397674 RepID=UPI0039E0BF34
MHTIEPHSSFGAARLPRGVEAVGITVQPGLLTALHAPANGPARGTVLVVPGFTGSKEDFTTFLPLLAERGWDAWAYSQRGQADSAAPAGLHNYELGALAADAVELADLLRRASVDGAPVHLVGHSLGGIVATAAAIDSPFSFASLTVLCSGPHGWPGRHQDTIDTVTFSGSIGLWNRDNPHTIGLPDSELSEQEAFIRLRAAHTSSENLLAGALLLQHHEDRVDELAATGLAVLIAHGEFDDKWPISDQRDMAERLGAQYSVISGGFHSPQLEAPVATAVALDSFWAGVPEAGRNRPADQTLTGRP